MKRILICEDEPHVVEGLKFLLRGADRTIETAPNGRIGLERVRRQRPDLLITDVMMPEMSGLELVSQLRSEEATRDLPIIILTAKGVAQEGTLAQDVWGAMLIGKPFDPKRLRQVVSEILASGACPSPSSV